MISWEQRPSVPMIVRLRDPGCATGQSGRENRAVYAAFCDGTVFAASGDRGNSNCRRALRAEAPSEETGHHAGRDSDPRSRSRRGRLVSAGDAFVRLDDGDAPFARGGTAPSSGVGDPSPDGARRRAPRSRRSSPLPSNRLGSRRPSSALSLSPLSRSPRSASTGFVTVSGNLSKSPETTFLGGR